MYLVLTASPNKEGLTAACGQSAVDGINSAGGQAELIDISALKLSPCNVCGNGWGTCRESSKCVIADALSEIQLKLRDSEGAFVVTPVYFAQPSERMKYFIDRYRRCEAFRAGGSWAKGKQFSLIAAAGGSGNGTASCLAEMESWCRAIQAIPNDRIGVTRFNRESALEMIRNAGSRMVKGNYFTGF